MIPSNRGFSIVELLIAMAVMTTCMGTMLALVVAAQGIATVQPEVADQQQRARSARQTFADALGRAGAGLDHGPLAGPLSAYFVPVVRSPEGGLTVWSITSATAQAETAQPLAPSGTTVDITTSALCPAAQSTCAFTASTTAIVFNESGCHEAVRIDDVLPAVLVLRPAIRGCAFGAGASVAEGAARTYFVDAATRQLLRRDDATGSILPVIDNVTSMEVELQDGGGRVRVTLRFASALLRVPEFVLVVDVAPPNLREAR